MTSTENASGSTRGAKSVRQVLCAATVERPVRNRKDRSPNERDHETSNQPESECENDRRRYPAPSSTKVEASRSRAARRGTHQRNQVLVNRPDTRGRGQFRVKPRIREGACLPRIVKDCPRVHRVRREHRRARRACLAALFSQGGIRAIGGQHATCRAPAVHTPIGSAIRRRDRPSRFGLGDEVHGDRPAAATPASRAYPRRPG